ncbi:MAG TPA: hypothetical protein VFN61_05525, partial [Acidimicrobiales bacterium]|nr:hypothetical protein [Acidimicrobiales bacterium]
ETASAPGLPALDRTKRARLAARQFDAGDLAVHLAASSVLERCPHPISELEVAVVLETLGYNRTRVHASGATNLMELARATYSLVPLYAPGSSGTPNNAPDGSEPGGWRSALDTAAAFCRGLLFAAPLLITLGTILMAGVSFWSNGVELPAIAASVTMSSCLALISTGPFIHAFMRRASFYLAFGDDGILAYMTRRALGPGMLTAVVALVATYLLRVGFGAGGAPAANRLGLATGMAIAALQLGLAPFYLRNAVFPMLCIIGGGAAVLVWHASHLGPFTDPVYLAIWQVRLVAAMAGATWLFSAWWLLRTPAQGAGAPRRFWLPSGRAVIRAVAPYAFFGLAYFCLVSLPQLVAGGAWRDRYLFNGSFAIASGMALVALVPVAAFGNVMADHLIKRDLPRVLQSHRVAHVERARSTMSRRWRALVSLAAATSMVAVTTVDLLLPRFAHGWLLSHGMAAAPDLLYTCSAGFFFLSVGMFASQLVFGLSSPTQPVLAALCGVLVLVGGSALLELGHLTGQAQGAAVSFAAGAAVFGLLAVRSGAKAFGNIDFTCYRSL